MFKLKYKMIKKMAYHKISSKEIDFILFLTKSLDELGQAKDIHYKEVCNELNISPQTFYNIVDKLNDIGIVKTKYLNKSTWDFVFDDNIFLTKNDLKDSYLNTNRDFLFSNDFKNLKANEKLLVLLLMIYTANNSFAIFFNNLKSWFNVSDSVMLSYIESLKVFFYIKVDGNKYIFIKNPRTSISNTSAKSKTFINQLKRWCLKHRIGFTFKDLIDVYNLYYVFESRAAYFLDLLVRTSFDYSSLQPAVLNYIMHC